MQVILSCISGRPFLLLCTFYMEIVKLTDRGFFKNLWMYIIIFYKYYDIPWGFTSLYYFFAVSTSSLKIIIKYCKGGKKCPWLSQVFTFLTWLFGFLYLFNKISLKNEIFLIKTMNWDTTHPYQTQRSLSSCLILKILKRIDSNLLSHWLISNVSI